MLRFLYKAVVVLLLLALTVAVAGVLWGAAQLAVFQQTVSEESLTPDITVIESIEDWEVVKADALQYFEQNQYGLVPTTEIDWTVEKRILAESFNGLNARLEHWKLLAPEAAEEFNIVALIPVTDSPVPLVVAANFCPNHTRFPKYDIPEPKYYPSMCGVSSPMSPVMSSVFGELIDTFPFEQFVEHNTALAMVYLGEGVADSEQYAYQDLEQLSTLTGQDVSGALAAWAWTYIEITRVFEEDDRIDSNHTAVYGHSRDGKSALLAAAHSEKIDLVLTHQSGKGGASPWQTGVGESVKAITDQYGFWFTPTFALFVDGEEERVFDQQYLLASVAPRPVLVSGARLDKWGDPAGALRAARDASSIYTLYGASGIKSTSLEAFEPSNQLAYFIRPWFHGVRHSDWDAFFEFLEQHFGSSYEE